MIAPIANLLCLAICRWIKCWFSSKLASGMHGQLHPSIRRSFSTNVMVIARKLESARVWGCAALPRIQPKSSSCFARASLQAVVVSVGTWLQFVKPCECNGKRLKLKMCCALQTHFLRLQLTIFINLVPNMHYAPQIILLCMSVNIHSLFSINSEEQARAARKSYWL